MFNDNLVRARFRLNHLRRRLIFSTTVKFLACVKETCEFRRAWETTRVGEDARERRHAWEKTCVGETQESHDLSLLPLFDLPHKLTIFSLPGRIFEPGFGNKPLARTTSTSNIPFLLYSASWMSPMEGDASTCRPTIWAGPKPSMKSPRWPSFPSFIPGGIQGLERRETEMG